MYKIPKSKSLWTKLAKKFQQKYHQWGQKNTCKLLDDDQFFLISAKLQANKNFMFETIQPYDGSQPFNVIHHRIYSSSFWYPRALDKFQIEQLLYFADQPDQTNLNFFSKFLSIFATMKIGSQKSMRWKIPKKPLALNKYIDYWLNHKIQYPQQLDLIDIKQLLKGKQNEQKYINMYGKQCYLFFYNSAMKLYDFIVDNQIDQSYLKIKYPHCKTIMQICSMLKFPNDLNYCVHPIQLTGQQQLQKQKQSEKKHRQKQMIGDEMLDQQFEVSQFQKQIQQIQQNKKQIFRKAAKSRRLTWKKKWYIKNCVVKSDFSKQTLQKAEISLQQQIKGIQIFLKTSEIPSFLLKQYKFEFQKAKKQLKKGSEYQMKQLIKKIFCG